MLVLAESAVQLIAVAGAAAAAAADVPQLTAMEQPHLANGRKLLQPFTLGLPPITRASDCAGSISENRIVYGGAGCFNSRVKQDSRDNKMMGGD